jgi:DNA topoisomerase-6 subunit B
MPATKKKRPARKRNAPANAQTLAKKQREISISEFFTKNRHLLGFDSPARALLTTIKEAVDNSLDACEDAGVLPDIRVEIFPVLAPNGPLIEEGSATESPNPNRPTPRNGATAGNDRSLGSSKGRPAAPIREERYRVLVEDNGPGIVRKQIPRIFGKLLYGSKFHSLKQSRGQQGIGISAAGMYGQLTTGEPVVITSRTGSKKPAHRFQIMLDTKKNEPVVLADDQVEWDQNHGTRVEITLEGSYKKGQHSVDTYLQQTCIANPHVQLTYVSPRGEQKIFARVASLLPEEATEIKPHPYGVELGLMGRLFKETKCRNLNSFLKEEFCRVGPKTAATILQAAGLPLRKSPKRMGQEQTQALLDSIANAKIPNPPTDCLSPIGEELVIAGLKQGIAADFFTAVTRPPAVYRGNPFQIEVGLAYGGEQPAEELARVMRFANRVPLLYQASACAIHRAVLRSNWRSYGLQQAKGALPTGPLAILVHMASVWVPFTSESKEAVAHYPEIIKEIRLALQEAGRQLKRHINRRVRERDALKKKSYIEKYIPHIGDALQEILALSDRQRSRIIDTLADTLERSRKI